MSKLSTVDRERLSLLLGAYECDSYTIPLSRGKGHDEYIRVAEDLLFSGHIEEVEGNKSFRFFKLTPLGIRSAKEGKIVYHTDKEKIDKKRELFWRIVIGFGGVIVGTAATLVLSHLFGGCRW